METVRLTKNAMYPASQSPNTKNLQDTQDSLKSVWRQHEIEAGQTQLVTLRPPGGSGPDPDLPPPPSPARRPPAVEPRGHSGLLSTRARRRAMLGRLTLLWVLLSPGKSAPLPRAGSREGGLALGRPCLSAARAQAARRRSGCSSRPRWWREGRSATLRVPPPTGPGPERLLRLATFKADVRWDSVPEADRPGLAVPNLLYISSDVIKMESGPPLEKSEEDKIPETCTSAIAIHSEGKKTWLPTLVPSGNCTVAGIRTFNKCPLVLRSLV
ncbi:uncharacterized protein LOC130684346 [Manis pentadactyla]|uniref:uncharacterized protein LOC130684346 n=1 Tax=Manis pentadactyla TaxID=143292 RepID=UPI00255CEAFC|nr:uncharacterized protein LOC130684346 [Manis pentadactyla]